MMEVNSLLHGSVATQESSAGLEFRTIRFFPVFQILGFQ